MSNETTFLELPVICTRGMLVFPGNRLSLDVGRPKSLNAINDGNNLYDKNVVFVSQINPLDEDPNYDGVYHVGTLCKIQKKGM